MSGYDEKYIFCIISYLYFKFIDICLVFSEEEMTLFPVLRSKDSFKHKQDLTDTFSIEELSEGSEDSLHLGSVESNQPHTRTYTPSGCFSCKCQIL